MGGAMVAPRYQNNQPSAWAALHRSHQISPAALMKQQPSSPSRRRINHQANNGLVDFHWTTATTLPTPDQQHQQSI